MLGAGVVGAQDTPRSESTASTFAGAETAVAGAEAEVSRVEASAVRLADGRLRVIVELAGEPAAVAFARAGGEGGGAAAVAAANAQRSAVAAEQAGFLATANGAGIGLQVFAEYDTVGNGLSVAVTAEQLAALRALPGVKAVHPVRILHRDTASSIQQIGAPSAWDGSLGGAYTGDGIVISIIDSGVDYTHTNNGGAGVWPLNPADRETLADTGGTFPAGNKVIGGYDYVGDFYDAATSGEDIPDPDADPIDCSVDGADLVPTYGFNPGPASGHGSHVAGIAAGFGVNADGSTYTGGYASVPFGSMLIGPGAAPMADVLAMRVFGCFGSTNDDVVADAIDDSVSGKYGAVADVINMSLGSSFGYGGDDASINPFYIGAINNALLAGTLVVASAGNSYDTFFVTGSPGVTPSALNVASASDGGEGGFKINDVVYPARFGIENPPKSVATAPFIYLPGNGCASSQYATFPADTFAVVNWTGACGSIGLMTAAQDAPLAGGNAPLGILVANNVPFAFQNLTCGYRGTQATPPYTACMSVSFETGQFLAANPSATITFDPALIAIATSNADTISVFSSRGPSRYATSGLKPEIAGPGDAITSTGSGLGSGPATLGGTSMAAPTVAGVAALLMQANPSWPAHQIKALLVNTANNDVFSGSTSGPRVGVQRMGSGRVDVVDAINSDVIAYNALRPEVASVHFGFPEVVPGGTTTISKTVRFVNKGATAATYDLSINTYSNANIASFAVSPASLTIPAFGTELATVTLTVTVPTSGTQTANRSDPSMSATHPTGLGTLTRHFLSEETANLVATPTSGATVPLRVPLYAAPRSASAMRAAANPVPYSGVAATEPDLVNLLPLTGTGVFDAETGFPQAVISSVTALEYVGSDAVGDTQFPAPGHDIQYVGFSSNLNSIEQPVADVAAMVGLSMAGEWATPNELFFVVYFDGNQDGFTGAADDFEVYTSAPNQSGTTSRSDVFFALACPSALGSACYYHEYLNNTGAGFNTYVLDNNVVVLPFYPYLPLNYDGLSATPATSLLASGDTTFNFYVEILSRTDGTGDPVDTSPVFSYDIGNPVFDATQVFGNGIWDDVDGNNIAYVFDASGINANRLVAGDMPAALLLHHHNRESMVSGNGTTFRRGEVVLFDVDTVDLVVSKTNSDADDKVLPGAEFTYFITAANLSEGVNTGATVTDVLPASLMFRGASPECTHTGEPVGGTVTCEADLGPIGTANFYIDVMVDPTFIGRITNTATVVSDVVETDPSDNTASDIINVTPPAPVGIAPSGNILDGSPAFSWNDINGAGWYYLSVTESEAVVYSGWFEKTAICTGGVCTAEPAFEFGPGAYQWAVYAWNEVSGAGPYSMGLNFSNISTPATPVLISPAGETTSTDPDFVWSQVLGADDYHFWLSRTAGPDSGLVHELFMTADGLCTGGTCTYNTPATLMAGSYTFWVQAHSDTSGAGLWSNGLSFDVNIKPATPVTIAPTGSITDTTPTFTFQGVSGAEWYYLWLSKGSTKILDQWYDGGMICGYGDEAAGGGGELPTCSVTPGVVLDAGSYEWFVQAWSSYGGYSDWSASTSFTEAIAPLPPVQVGPVGAILQTNPAYTWQRSAGATNYAIWVSSTSGYVLDRWVDAAAVCTGDTCSTIPGVVLANGTYRWWVQAWNPWGGYSLWNGPQVFNVGGAGATGNAEIAPVLPFEQAPVDPSAVEILPEAPAEGS